MFHTFLFCLCTWRLISDAYKDNSVIEGDSITLYNMYDRLHMLFMIEWKFGAQDSLIVTFYTDDKRILIHDDVLDGRFRGRLQVDDQTGCLTITNTKTKDSGLYQLITTSSSRISDGIRTTPYRFYVNVYAARLPVPIITSYCSQNPLSSERSSVCKCVLLCSVMNVSLVSLSWYKGISLLSSVSVSDLNSIMSLHLDVEYQDTNTYRCVISHPFRNQTQHLNITDVCQTCSARASSCDTNGAGIRLAVCALVGVAAVAALVVLIYDIRSRRAEPRREDQGHRVEDKPPSDRTSEHF